MKIVFLFISIIFSVSCFTQGLDVKFYHNENQVRTGMALSLNQNDEKYHQLELGFTYEIRKMEWDYSERKKRWYSKITKIIFPAAIGFNSYEHPLINYGVLVSLKNKELRTGPFSFHDVDLWNLGVQVQHELAREGGQYLGLISNVYFGSNRDRKGLTPFTVYFSFGFNVQMNLSSHLPNYSFVGAGIRCRLTRIKDGGY